MGNRDGNMATDKNLNKLFIYLFLIKMTTLLK